MTKEKQKLRETLRKLFALLGSPNKHEADTARQKIDELAAKYKMTWNDVIELVGKAQAMTITQKLLTNSCRPWGTSAKSKPTS
jgi:hypothetical protein